VQLQRTCLRILGAVRPGGIEHVTVAAIHAVDVGAVRQAIVCCMVTAHCRWLLAAASLLAAQNFSPELQQAPAHSSTPLLPPGVCPSWHLPVARLQPSSRRRRRQCGQPRPAMGERWPWFGRWSVGWQAVPAVGLVVQSTQRNGMCRPGLQVLNCTALALLKQCPAIHPASPLSCSYQRPLPSSYSIACCSALPLAQASLTQACGACYS